MSKKLIDVDMWVESHERGTKETRSTGSHSGAGFSQSSHVDRADRADIADRAETADEANHAKKADEATTADEANHAKTADEVNLESKTLSHFLRNDIPNTAAEVVTFLKGVIAKTVSFFQGIVNKGDITNSGTITTKNLNVTGKATFFELMIQITKAAGGMTVYSPGAFHIDAVKDAGDYFACFQRAEKDGVKLRQMCDIDDQLMCARFNVDGNGNKFYWMRVSYISSNTVQHVVDGKLVDCLEVRLDKSVKSDNCQGVPEIGDALAVFGNRTKEDRQSVIVISAYNSFDIDLHAPYIAQYEHVNDFNLESKKTTWLSKGGNNLTGTFTVVSGGKYVSLDDFVTKISQATFKVEANKITATVARKSDLEDVRTEIKQTAESFSLTVANGTRPNLLWGSDLDLDGVDTTNKEAIQKHLGIVISDDMEIGNRDMFEYLKGEGVGGSDAIHFKNVYKREGWAKWTNFSWMDVPLKPNTKYTISVWVKFKSYGKKGRMYVDCNSDDGRYCFGGYLYKEHYYDRADINEWQRVRYVFNSGASKKMNVLNFCCIADEEEGAQCEIWLCHPKLEEGNTATPWCAYDGTMDALLAGGFDAKNRKFTATADNFVVQNNKGEKTFFVDENGRINNGLLSLDGLDAKRAVIKRLRFQSNSVAPYFVTEESIKEFAAYCTRYYAGYGAKPLLPFDVAMFFVFLIKPKWLTNIDQGYNKDFSQRSRDIAVSESMAHGFPVDYFSFALELFWHNMVGKTVTIANATNENISFGAKLKTRVFDSNGKNVMQIGGRLDNLPSIPGDCVESVTLLPGQMASYRYMVLSGARTYVKEEEQKSRGYFLLQDLFDFSYYKKLFEVGYDTEQGFNLFDKKYIDLFNTDKEHVEPKGGFPKTKRKY